MFFLQCTSVARPHSANQYAGKQKVYSVNIDPSFVQVIKIANVHPTWMKVLNVYLPQRVQVSEDWNNEAYFCIQGSI